MRDRRAYPGSGSRRRPISGYGDAAWVTLVTQSSHLPVNATVTVVDRRVQAVVTVTSCPAGIAWALDWPVSSVSVSVPAGAEETRSETSWRNDG